MAVLLKHWYLIAIALVLSLTSSVMLIFMRKDSWNPGDKIEDVHAAPLSDVGPTASQSFKDWEFSASELEHLRLQLEDEKAALRVKEDELKRLEAQIQSERVELNALRGDLEALRESIQEDLIVIEENERQNLRSLSQLYAEMKAPAAVKVLTELDVETVVKILSLMPADASARILGTLADLPESGSTQRAAEITEAIRNLKK